MDSARFDGLVRRFGQLRSRRQTLRGLAGAAGLLLLDRQGTGAQACKRNGKPCKKPGQCCSGNCVGASGGSVNDGTCQEASECTGRADGTPCGGTGSGLRCCNGSCPSPTCRTAGTPCAAGETPDTCRPKCCTERIICGTTCECQESDVGPSGLCASDADCINPFGTAQCICEACCVAPGSAKASSDPCSICCSGMCGESETVCA
jgi:hypothetical protein